MGNDIWVRENQRFMEFVKGVRIPDGKLNDVDWIGPKHPDDFDSIPSEGGCYWIWTNEPIAHYLHPNHRPQCFDGGEIIYNGIAKDDLRGRVKKHLLGDLHEGWSGVSIDLYFNPSPSHRKKAMSARGKVGYRYSESDANSPRLVQIRTKDNLLKLNLSPYEKEFVLSSESTEFYFRNGINIFEDKHLSYQYRVYFIVGLTPLYLEHIEKEWRKQFGLPRLCSYSSGR